MPAWYLSQVLKLQVLLGGIVKRLKSQIPGAPAGCEGNWYAPFDMMLNDLGFWYPILRRTGVSTPKTIIINGGDSQLIKEAMDYIGYPCFLRGGQTSAKHDWKKTCFVPERLHRTEILERMSRIIGVCVNGNVGGQPLLYDNWVVREYIRTDPVMITNYGMPVNKEVRFFLRDGVIECTHPYWPEKAIRREGGFDPEKYKRLCDLSAEGPELLSAAQTVADYFYGYWSCDFLKGSDGIWYCTDMAQGEDSFHFPDCSNLKDSLAEPQKPSATPTS